MNILYPIKFNPIFKEKIWGGTKMREILKKDFSPLPNCGESWEISAVKGDISVISNGFLEGNNLQDAIEIYMGDLVGDAVYEEFGIEFPLLIKFIDSNDDLSIQVHPDDELALQRHDAYGKTEMWYIVHADDKAKLISGFKKNITKSEFIKHLNQNSLTELVHYEDVKSGDAFFIPAGQIHALCKGILLAEIQQTSDITYRIFDWNRLDANGKPRELHTQLAMDAIDFKNSRNGKISYQKKMNDTNLLVSCNYFAVNLLEFNKKVDRDYHYFDSFIIYICLEGNCQIIENNRKTALGKGEVILIPAVLKEIELIPENNCKLLEVYIES